MQSVFTVKCKACGSAMDLIPRKDSPKWPLKCPNCGQTLQREEFGLLYEAMQAIYALPHETSEEGISYADRGFCFSVQVNSPSFDAQDE